MVAVGKVAAACDGKPLAVSDGDLPRMSFEPCRALAGLLDPSLWDSPNSLPHTYNLGKKLLYS